MADARCPRCDREECRRDRFAEPWDAASRAEGADCAAHVVDWRARALAAESALASAVASRGVADGLLAESEVRAVDMMADLAAARLEAAAERATVDRLYDATGYTVDEMIAYDEVVSAQRDTARLEAAAARWAAWIATWTAIGHCAAAVYVLDLVADAKAHPTPHCAHCQAIHDVESGSMAAHVRECEHNPMVRDLAAARLEIDSLKSQIDEHHRRGMVTE